MTPSLTVERACELINDFEARFRKARPEARWVYVEPDIPRTTSELQRRRAAN
jgi:hypothetical protein